ncbi:trans-sulfuration enzyme family protein [Aneurinibacillus aneurinilyticus]|uniref:Cystathionine beta-lyase n=1 Tax=Aneurinibacillus aneurinilyticus ATCC 12856 TaxID=649747 RepID=U1YKM3_ANEAE|nr:PLP-dependent aspartate aminotransferase family protein [Aneurinibacillus aneurinilyticus]ERI11316.1 cystathionine beta-lyase [Aneurinibacillus aneurinilyticus ATCC 12856]MED0706082.1 PLP-dependent aspartate aminotransferase family protein [Aneurinibacillus aneurinilyticus]MED0723275.1 PLP-dependent aspartate aminotransferase family protein [Aneurinibacillus aneurinilyticus]MED0732657.1 PLP-dependent aspartate aminotransferase family protein [Aneurinibacillus aneurinilyticus]MED0739793.1 PL
MNMETLLVRAGMEKDNTTGAISTPIYQSATFQHPELGESTGYDYSRTANPTRTALEEAIASLEGGTKGFAFSSGMAAITTVLFLFKPGDHLVVSEDLYGGTYRLLTQVFHEFGITASFVDTSCIENVEAAICSETKALLIETPTNPLMKITDLRRIADVAKTHDLLLIVDNTFMTPYLQQPLALGADITLHSATKYLGGHNDTVAGLVAVREEELGERIGLLQNACGSILGPQDSWLILRGIKTLAIRLEKQQQNALALARWLQKHPEVEAVHYPGLPEHSGHHLAGKQASGFGAMLSFSVRNPQLVPHLLKNVKIITFAESLGGVESLITFPARQTHADIPEEAREQLGITDRLLRLSVGIENIDDLLTDLEEALRC